MSDIWSALRQIPNAIATSIWRVIKAIGEALSAPFWAFTNTLLEAGLPEAWAQPIAMFVVGITILGVIIAIIKLKGLLG